MAWYVVGWSSLALGLIGAFLPLLPTTPFVILAAFAFGKSAPALQQRLEQNRLFGPAIARWRAHGAISPRHKLLAVVMMAAAFVLALAVGVGAHVLALQAICLIAAGVFVVSRPGGPAAERQAVRATTRIPPGR